VTDESQALAHEIMNLTGVAEKTIRAMQKVFDGDSMPPLAELLDINAFAQHLQRVGTLTYAEVYTETEMRDAIAFFRSPSGRAMKVKEQIIGERVAAAVNTYLESCMKGVR
jgi:hypothetical protein